MFKKGDKVRCIDAGSGLCLTLGKVYTVIDAYPYAVRILDDDEDEWNYRKHRFELVNEANIDVNDSLNISAVLGEAVFRGESMLTVNGVTFKVIKV